MLSDIFISENIKKITKSITFLLEELVKELQKTFYEDLKDNEEAEIKSKKKNKYENSSKYIRENGYYKNQFRMKKRNINICNRCKRF